MSDFAWYSVAGINPEPWEAAQGAIGRRGGKAYIQFFKTTQLRNYQEAVAEEFKTQNQHWELWHLVETPLEVQFYFWRELSIGEGQKKQVRAHVADATNLQKALEDALQGILYKNDRQIRSVSSTIVSQNADTTPFILVGIREHPASELVSPTILRSSLDTGEQVLGDNRYDTGVSIF